MGGLIQQSPNVSVSKRNPPGKALVPAAEDAQRLLIATTTCG
jgi:hypothetical protein